jgi:tRNA-dihydrouridine synthase
VVKGSGTLLLGNGDIHSLEEVVRRVRETRVDGVLVGRGVLGAPWFFREREQARRLAAEDHPEAASLPAAGPATLEQRFAILLDHARQFHTLYGQGQFHRMRKHLGWYCKGFPHAAALRARMFRLSSVDELEAVIADYHAERIVDAGVAEPADETTTVASRCS